MHQVSRHRTNCSKRAWQIQSSQSSSAVVGAKRKGNRQTDRSAASRPNIVGQVLNLCSARADHGLLVQPQGPPLSREEEEIQHRFHEHLSTSDAFLRYVLTELCRQQRIVEVMALPSSLHEQVSDFLTSVRCSCYYLCIRSLLS
jgi:hypothetical protein